MRILINADYGGFSLSKLAEATLHLMGMGGTEAVDEAEKETKRSTGYAYNYGAQEEDPYGLPLRDRLDLADVVLEGSDCKYVYYNYSLYLHKGGQWFGAYVMDLERHDPKLINLYETLGNDAVGERTKLKIVEWPDEVPYTIHDYDGWESVRIDDKAFLGKLQAKLEDNDVNTCRRLLRLALNVS